MTAHWYSPAIRDVIKITIGRMRWYGDGSWGARKLTFECDNGIYVELDVFSHSDKPIAVLVEPVVDEIPPTLP